MKQYSIQALLYLFVVPIVALANGPATDARTIASPPNFANMSYGDADKAVYEILWSVLRKEKTVGPEFVPDLVDQLRHGKLTDEKKVLLIYALGLLHPTDTNSIEALIENIDLKAPHLDPAYGIPRWGQYPAAEALWRIGVPTIDPILRHLPTESNSLRRHLMCGVLISVEQTD
jgi:hypothetical protein